ncbi:MerR family transcriptional regulator [Planotetraspora sp. A-T 1434]|uniref:MerR family transcriptional regulator n=1 Tax=Planotetraspora sp. A-T 1434 TaxID=2979219 RepID=UPI0021C224C2|nr:MerR family transcriptional regulator [Planotetraspora sp. A-T 1434]MCT9930291.1 MerR family transcriptional regulator [Planotetraspora sp. A-T 1434]
MRIGELAARASVSVRALRYYEEQNLLTAERSSSGQRHYPDSAVDRVQLIQHLYAAGLTSRTIVDLLPSFETGEVWAATLDRLSAEQKRVNRKIGELVGIRDRLDVIITKATEAKIAGRSCRD